MAEARKTPGPLARLRDRLMISASARELAIDLVERHGAGAREAARALAAAGGLSPQQRLVLARAEPIVATLIAGAPAGARGRAPSRAGAAARAMATAD